jgi:hypothetical protein
MIQVVLDNNNSSNDNHHHHHVLLDDARSHPATAGPDNCGGSLLL